MDRGTNFFQIRIESPGDYPNLMKLGGLDDESNEDRNVAGGKINLYQRSSLGQSIQ